MKSLDILDTPNELVKAVLAHYFAWVNRDEPIYQIEDLEVEATVTTEGVEGFHTVLVVSDGDQPADLLVTWEPGYEVGYDIRLIVQCFDTMISLVYKSGDTYLEAKDYE